MISINNPAASTTKWLKNELEIITTIKKEKKMDKIADMLSKIQNAQKRGKSFTTISSSKLKKDILKILFIEGYIKGYSAGCAASQFKQNKLCIYLGYNETSSFSNSKMNENPTHKIIRISRPGKRIYIQSKDINKVKRGLGILLLSTRQGILCDRDARFFNLGGEALCQIY